MSEYKEYIVTLHNYEYLDQFYVDMESVINHEFVPDREVECYNKRPISRSTHYYLSDEEAKILENDPRVLAVELKADIKIVPSFIQSANTWNKNNNIKSEDKNWGLLRCTLPNTISGWSDTGTQPTNTIQINAEGRNVDVVILDSILDNTNPEFMLNSDGTGGTRIIQYNWYQHNADVWPSNPSNTYPYANNNTFAGHGAEVAGIVVGNTNGWARKSNIYNYNLYSELLYYIDYVRAFHKNKQVNPITGRKNPTIVNCSFIYIAISENLDKTIITSITYRGTTYYPPFTTNDFNTFGMFESSATTVSNGSSGQGPQYTINSIKDAISEGIIFVAAAGNSSAKCDYVGGIDYDNYYTVNGSALKFYYNRGLFPSSANNVISVGAISTNQNEYKATYSPCGPTISIYSPGQNIITTTDQKNRILAVDTRYPTGNCGFVYNGGTSFSAPQVTGVLACALETYPNMTANQALQYLISYANKNQMASSNTKDTLDLQGSNNYYLYYHEERPNDGNLYPRQNYFLRPDANSTGILYPRTNIRKL